MTSLFETSNTNPGSLLAQNTDQGTRLAEARKADRTRQVQPLRRRTRKFTALALPLVVVWVGTAVHITWNLGQMTWLTLTTNPQQGWDAHMVIARAFLLNICLILALTGTISLLWNKAKKASRQAKALEERFATSPPDDA